jgi:curli production assembly/transport component CsgF
MKKTCSVLAICTMLAPAASAGQLVYQPVTPAFGGNPNNYSWLQGNADAQNQFKDTGRNAGASQPDMTQQFIQMLETQIYAGLAQSVSNAIFGKTCASGCAGTISLGGQSVAYQNTGTEIKLQITDQTGKVTAITVPTILTTSSGL